MATNPRFILTLSHKLLRPGAFLRNANRVTRGPMSLLLSPSFFLRIPYSSLFFTYACVTPIADQLSSFSVEFASDVTDDEGPRRLVLASFLFHWKATTAPAIGKVTSTEEKMRELWFLGRVRTAEVKKVICLVWTSDRDKALARLKEGLMDRGVLRDEWMKGGRLDVLIGDLSLDNFDLGGEEWNRVAEEADAIPHNGVPESGDLEGARASLKTGQSKWIFEKLSFEDGRKGLRGHILQTPDVQDELKNEALALLNNPLPHPPATLISPRYEWQIPDRFGNSIQNPQPGRAGAPYAFRLQGKDPLPSASLPDPVGL
ncbi:hypothetical protein EDD18DRAFT_1109591 [Armillaria luteobubalina]|uniref:Thioester reductase (TE) domain-containing protein n=1 Tax=Armillaria luteobubalina TaxID=153913 RepID=A0AA39PWH3_9AGAR|nr:hypothetical protein EDD18DRAFT_1109591 [Armillaria luteobubalina]